jgi:hypothetical protein
MKPRGRKVIMLSTELTTKLLHSVGYLPKDFEILAVTLDAEHGTVRFCGTSTQWQTAEGANPDTYYLETT